jgi:hypothetical protein
MAGTGFRFSPSNVGLIPKNVSTGGSVAFPPCSLVRRSGAGIALKEAVLLEDGWL